MKNNQIKFGAILAYALIVINAVYGIIIIPFLLSKFGVSSYGVYKSITAFSTTLLVADLGIGATVIRYTAKFNAGSRKDKIENYLVMAFVQTSFICVVLFMVCVGLYRNLDLFLNNSFTTEEFELAQNLFKILVANIVLQLFENILFGVISGMGRFIFGNFMKLSKILLRICLIFIILNVYESVIMLVLIDSAVILFTLCIEYSYIRFKLKLKIGMKLDFWDTKLFKESLSYSLIIVVQTIIVQLNSSIPNIIIASSIGPIAVAIYSIGLQFYLIFQNLATAISNLMLPSAMNLVVNNAKNEELENLVIKVGRFEFLLLSAALSGFILLGQEFIFLWVGNGYKESYYVALILMSVSIWPTSQNVCLSILRARNKMIFRTIVMGVMFIVTVFFIKFGISRYGIVYAAVGTAIGIFFANFLAMNLYYHFHLKLNVIRIWMGITRRLFLCVLATTIVSSFVFRMIIGNSWGVFLVKSLIFVVNLTLLTVLFGFNQAEKEAVSIIKRSKLYGKEN
jgi:O-antigen/teichoic acid export membrane protein